MRNLFFAFLIIPQIVFSQYKSRMFVLPNDHLTSCVNLGYSILQDTTITLNINDTIYGMYISGHYLLNDPDSGYIRVTMKDNNNVDYLVYELYPLLADSLSSSFLHTAIETVSLDGIIPQSVEVEVENAILTLDSLSYMNVYEDFGGGDDSFASLQEEQNQFIINTLNQKLEEKRMLWRAGRTNLSQMTYDEKKDLYGGIVPHMYGWEYYKGGVFCLPGSNFRTSQNNAVNDTAFVKEWDWRNRHGKNWITSVKNQHTCYSCWAFSALGVLETYINLFYNQLINYDLSEQELISCIDGYGCRKGGNPGTAFSYIKSNGVVLEECFQNVYDDADCSLKCQSPSERLFIDNYVNLSNSISEGEIKQRLFNAPITFGVRPWWHVMMLVGYKTIELGDSIYVKNTQEDGEWIVVDSLYEDFIGKTAWLVKNSYGSSWGDNGYGYIVTNSNNRYLMYNLMGNVSSMEYDENDVVCEDSDGDGYYYWGIGPKPASCPSWAPDEPDGDDSHSCYGPVEAYGYLENNFPNCRPVIYINDEQQTQSSQGYWNNIVINTNGKWDVRHNSFFFNGASITVKDGGNLTLSDGIELSDTVIIIEPGGRLFINDGSRIKLRQGTQFSAPIGAVVEINQGSIE